MDASLQVHCASALGASRISTSSCSSGLKGLRLTQATDYYKHKVGTGTQPHIVLLLRKKLLI